MKRYHEAACLVNPRNEICGFLLFEGDLMNIPLGTKCFPVSKAEFTELVKNDKVQFFNYNERSGNVELSYTQEELKMIKKSRTLMIDNEHDYFRSDLAFDASILYRKNEYAVGISICAMKTIAGQNTMMTALYRPTGFNGREIMDLEKNYDFIIPKKSISKVQNLLTVSVDEGSLYNYITYLRINNIPYSINTSRALFFDNMIYKSKQPFAKKTPEETIRRICNHFNYMNTL